MERAMTATALISRSGRAVVRDGETFYVLTADDPSPLLADGTHWAHLRGLYPNADLVPAGLHPFPDVRAHMLAVWREQLALDLVLLALDRDHDDAFRSETCGEIEKLLESHPSVGEAVRAILLSIKAPEDADFAGGIAVATVAGAKRVKQLFLELSGADDTIATVTVAWRNALATLSTPADQADALSALCRLHAVGHAVFGLRDSAPSAWPQLRAWCLTCLAPAIASRSVNGVALIERWLAPLEGHRTHAAPRASLTASYPRIKAPSFLSRRAEQPIPA
jgi:hypothetical protein